MKAKGPHRPGLKRLAGLLVLSAALPLVAGILALIASDGRHVAALKARHLEETARLAARAADAEIEGRRLALLAFGSRIEPGAIQDDIASADAAARQLAEALGSPVGVFDRGLGMLIDTSQPFGTPLPSSPAIATGLWAAESGRPRVSERLQSPGGTPLPPVLMVPLAFAGRVEYVVSVELSTRRLGEALGPRPAVLLDGRGRIVARSADGTAGAPPDWSEVSGVPEGKARLGAGGRIRYVVQSLTEAPQWRVVVWEPAAPGRGLLGQVLLPVGIAFAIAGALGLLAWRRAVRGLREPLEALRRHAATWAEALRGDRPLPAPPAMDSLPEIAALGAALAEVQNAMQRRERRLRALAEYGALVLWRADAAGGWQEVAGWTSLTGQPPSAARGDGWIEMLHPDDRAPTRAEWDRTVTARGVIGIEFRLRKAEQAGAWRWVRATGVPILDEDGSPLEWVGAIHDVTDIRGAGAAHRTNAQQLRQTVAELRAVYDSVPVGLALVDPQLRFVNVNARFAAISGLPPEAHIARTPREVTPEGLALPLEAAQRKALETGRPVLDVACSGQAPGTAEEVRHWLASCHPIKTAEGSITGVSCVLQDVTDRVRIEQSRELLETELNQRVTNMLATVQAIAAQSLGHAGPDEAGPGRNFLGRLQALTRCHDLLAEHRWNRIDLALVVRAALRPWLEEGRSIRLMGAGRIQLEPAQVQAIVLALHELAANAVKYGALSRSGGEVTVRWALAEEGMATLDWSESGGPPVTPPPPERRGFGVRLLERGTAHDLGPDAEVRLTFATEGVQAVLRFRVAAPMREAEATP